VSVIRSRHRLLPGLGVTLSRRRIAGWHRDAVKPAAADRCGLCCDASQWSAILAFEQPIGMFVL
jgi:hypothetical protein